MEQEAYSVESDATAMTPLDDDTRQKFAVREVVEPLKTQLLEELHQVRLEVGHKVAHISSEQATLVRAMNDNRIDTKEALGKITEGFDRLSNRLTGEGGLIIRVDRLEQRAARQEIWIGRLISVVATLAVGLAGWAASQAWELLRRAGNAS